MALDSRSRPTRRPARRRLPLLTALVLLTMSAGFWAWLCAPAAPQATPVSAPLLHTAAVQVDGAEHSQAEAADSAPAEPGSVPQATAETDPVGSTGDTPVVGDTPVAAGPRAPPAAS